MTEEEKKKILYKCAIGTSIEVVTGKWSISILLQLRDRTMRFGELQRSMDISQKMLTQQLKELEQNGIIIRKVYAEVPLRVEYSMSEYGQTLLPILEALYEWGVKHYVRTKKGGESVSAFLERFMSA